MRKIQDFLEKYGVMVILFLLVVLFTKQCSINSKIDRECKYTKELVKEIEKKDSIINVNMELMNYKMDSTLISNSAVINSNKVTSSAINNQKQQPVVVKVVPTK